MAELPSPAALEAACAARALDVEGIPMVLALEDLCDAPDARGLQPGPAGPASTMRDDGNRFAELMLGHWAAVRPGAPESDYWAVHDTLAAISYLQAPQPLQPGEVALKAAPGRPAAPAEPVEGLPPLARHLRALRGGRFLRVVNYHLTPADRRDRLEHELRSYAADFDAVTPEHLGEYFGTGRWPLPRPGFVAAFYDGYREHAEIAAGVCERLGIRGWFLPPTGFLDCAAAGQAAYCQKHNFWLPHSAPPGERLALDWAELEGLGRRHVLVAHTHSHATPESVITQADVERELVRPRQRLGGPAVAVWGGGEPYRPAAKAFKALHTAGYRYLLSATMLQRLPFP